MTATTPYQGNTNYLSSNGYQLVIVKLPHVTYTVQNTNIPAVEAPTATIDTPMLDYPLPGYKMVYAPLVVKILVDEDMVSYIETLMWMTSLNNSQSLSNNRAFIDIDRGYENPGKFLDNFSDIHLTILNNNNKDNIEFSFVDAFPISVGPILMESDVNDMQYRTCTITFAYSYFLPKSVK